MMVHRNIPVTATKIALAIQLIMALMDNYGVSSFGYGRITVEACSRRYSLTSRVIQLLWGQAANATGRNVSESSARASGGFQLAGNGCT